MNLFVVMPYFPYSRQDKISNYRTSLTAKVLLKMIETSGASRIVTMNLHSNEICGFSKLPIINIDFESVILEIFKKEFPSWSNFLIVAPDAGSQKRCLRIMQKYGLNGGFIHKGTYLILKAFQLHISH